MIELDGSSLTPADVALVARAGASVALAPVALEHVREARGWVEEIAAGDRPVYGINTGFGVFADRRIPSVEIERLNRNLILSHASGAGPILTTEVTRAAMLVRANTLAKGYSGVRPQIIQTLIEMLNRGVTPCVPEQGSLGSSGDLAPLSFMAMVFTTTPGAPDIESGLAEYQGQVISGAAAMQAAGIPRLVLEAKEGLAINNGATFSAALGALAVVDAACLLEAGEIAAAMSFEALLGCSPAFDARVQELRGHPGQVQVAARMRRLISGSQLIDSAGRVQDAYSLRCVPQVHGASAEAVGYARAVIEREINAATDNPLLLGPGKIISCGNFHGEPVGMALDFLGIAMAELGAISERRIFRLTDGRLSGGLPPMLVDHPDAAGLNSGLMMPQYTAAALVLENRTLAVPDSVQSLPTSAGQEDVNANSMTAARHARKIVKNTQYILAVECFAAARALDLRTRRTPDVQPGQGVLAAWQALRARVPYEAGDTWWKPGIDSIAEFIGSGELARAVDAALDER